MKICLAHNLYEPFSRGGAEQMVARLIEAITAAGHEPILITTKPVFKRRPKRSGLKTYYINSWYWYLASWPLPARFVWQAWQLANPWRERQLKRLLKKSRAEAVLTHNLLGLGFGLGRAAQRLGLKHIHWLHDIQLLHPSGLMFYGREAKLKIWPAKIYSSLTKKMLGSPSAVISPSAWLLNLHEKHNWFSDSQTIILLNPFKAKSKAEAAEAHDFTFLYAGQLEEHKGVNLLLAAFNKFLADDHHAKLVLAGDGSLFKTLHNQPLPRVSLEGRLTAEALTKAMNQADCLVVPSLCYENSPTVIYEAAHLDLPVIAADLGGTKELLPEAYLFTPTVKALTDKLIWASEHKLKAPELATLTPAEYWQKIAKLLN